MTSGQKTAKATSANFIVSVAPHRTSAIGKMAMTGIVLKNSITPIALRYANTLSPASEPRTTAPPPPASRPMPQPASVSRTADHRFADVS